MRRESLRLRWRVLAVSVALVALALPTSTALGSDARVVVAGASPIPANVTVVDRTITTTFDVTLAPRLATGLTNFIASLSNTASPNFHRYLTPVSFAQRYGASSTSVTAVRNYFDGFGLQVGSLSASRLLLHVKGTTSQIAHAFDARVVTVRRSNGALAAQLATTGSVPSPVANHIAGVAGLSSVVQPSTNLVTAHMSAHDALPTTCPNDGGETGVTPNINGGYTPFQFAQLYGFASEWANNITGSGQTIAVYELSAFDPGDLATYLNCYGLNPVITPISVDGGATGSYGNEPTLDIEEIAAMAPGANIEVYSGPNNSTGPIDTYQQIADDNTASIVSTSWGTCESDPQGDPAAAQPIFEQMAAQGQTVASAAGDTGSSDCNGITNNALAVDDPASQPYVTGVGGLSVNSIQPLSETVWNSPVSSGDPGAGGGGTSVLWSRPAWQVAPGMPSSATMRMVPDLSTDANPQTGFVEYFTGSGQGACQTNCVAGWGSVGGTSIGAPIVSSLVAIGAQACGTGRLGFINPSLYAMASSGFNDVTVGSNDLYNVGAYSAGPGYDEASGLGSPNGAAFFAGLCAPKFDGTLSSFKVSKSSTAVNVPVTITATLHNTNNGPLANAQVDVTATNNGSNGQVLIDGAHSGVTTNGSASATVATNASGVAQFSVSGSEAGSLSVTVSYESQTIDKTTIQVTQGSKTNSKVPGRAVIARLTALVGGFELVVRAPSSNGGSVITTFQYSLSGGARWIAFAKGSTSIRVTNLAKGKSYHVNVRALNANGAGAASTTKSIVTRT
ncbi:MAG TPA: protease pro-enzyme activation domain-containing protein [Acidimicrobiales bacterium]|nr:protease pro-enzyme activation domain-containing protein [Acidimicrobiales bacterium]